MAGKVTAEKNYKVVESSDGYEFKITRKRPVAVFSSIGILIFTLFLAFVFFSFGKEEPNRIGVILLVITFFINFVLLRKKSVSFTIGKEGVIIKNSLYSFDDVSAIGCRTPSGVIAHSGLSFRGNAQVAATAAISRVSCNIYGSWD